ncbi:MAG: alpha/beta hydrolase, partial [Acholeplasmataceae bacterium]|nr:alpha/beta hydrolase [Acholeplasmataceae bacterium]
FGDSSYYKRISSLADFATDVFLFMQAKGIHKSSILGWSLGGGVAMKFAALYPQSTEKLILVNSTTHKGYPVFRKDALGQSQVGQVYESPEAMGKDPVQVLPLLDALNRRNFATLSYIYDATIYTVNKPKTEDNQLWINESLKQRNLVDADWALANLNMSDESNFYTEGTQDIHKVKASVFHTWGRKDVVVPEYMVLENVKAMEKQSSYVIYENCGHSPFVDVPDQITKDILDFIKS